MTIDHTVHFMSAMKTTRGVGRTDQNLLSLPSLEARVRQCKQVFLQRIVTNGRIATAANFVTFGLYNVTETASPQIWKCPPYTIYNKA